MADSPASPTTESSLPPPSSSSSLSLSTPAKPTNKNKPRLYIALYPRSSSSTQPHCDSWHWSLIVSTQSPFRNDSGTRYHVAHEHDDAHNPFFYEEQDIPTTPATHAVLIRITVAKVRDEDRLRRILRDIPIRAGDESFGCYAWVKEAYRRLMADRKCLKSYLGGVDWSAVETCARLYCKRKRDAGRFQPARVQALPRWHEEKVSTFNYWENREVVA